MNILTNAAAIKEYQSSVAQDIKSIECSRKEEIFNDLVGGRTISHLDINNNLGLFNYENIFDFFTVDASLNDFNALATAIQHLREAQNEVDGIKDKAAGYDRLMEQVKKVTDILDTSAAGHINENYEEICRHQDSRINCAA
jgi:hypothetical protein